ncbi:MAG TPA: CPBP family intramembrane glutamic endopeptidase [Bryobacteraceae bacterium]|nr:CPBP family intramembrane glutamic endopeptidase [Bryobacteraceae bacterium]
MARSCRFATNAADGWRFAPLLGFLALIFAGIASLYLRRYALTLGSASGIYCCFMLLLAFVIAPGIRGSRALVRRWLDRRYSSLGLVVLWCVPYLIYAAGTGDFRWIAILRLLVLAIPMAATYRLFPVRDISRFCWQDAGIAILLIASVLFHRLRGVWNVPVNLDFMARLYLIGIASWSWVSLRTLPGLGYHFSVSTKVFRAAALNFVYFAMIAIPLGLAMHFTAWNPRWRNFPSFGLDYLEIFLFIALLEELFFRGFLQNLISGSLQSWWKGQLIVSCLFGLFHILHAPFPNWRYVALASIAGWFYGSAFRQGGNLMAPALTHAMVDTVWRTWFSRI